MKAIFRLFVLILLVAGWGLAALSLHVIRTKEQIPITLITKDKFGLTDTWVDTTTWTMQDVAKHPIVVERLIRSHKTDVLKHVVDPKQGDIEQQLGDAPERAAVDEDTSKDAAVRFARRAVGWRWE